MTKSRQSNVPDATVGKTGIGKLTLNLLQFSLRTRAHAVLGYALALGLSVSAFLVHYGVGERGFPFVTFIPAVMLATLVGGRGPGIACGIVSGLMAWYFFMPPLRTFSLAGAAPYALFLYVLTVAINIAVIETMYRALEEYRAEKALTATMFQELQHRTANNLQFIGSMLSIQKRKVQKNPAVAESVLEEATQRLNTMARIHRRLYDPGNAGIEFGRLVEELSRDLIRAVGAQNVECVVDMLALSWEPDRLITLALLVTEIMTNSLKHAFTERGGTIRVSLTQNDPGRLELIVADDGRGLPDDFNPNAGKSLGMQIIQGLVNQVGGTLEIINANGTLTRVVMPA